METIYKALIGAGIGWVILGPMGAIIGGMIGAQSSKQISRKRRFHPYSQTQKGDFYVSLVVIFAYVVKADKKIRKSEISYVKNYLLQNVSNHNLVQDLMNMLKNVLEKEIEIQKITQQIADNMDYASRLQLIHLLFGIALADGELHSSEKDAIRQITVLLKLPMQDYQSIFSMYHQKNRDSAYKILEISPDATVDEIKNAYKKMANKYHPDKVSHLGEDMVKMAEEKFKAINNAYSSIRKRKGF
ncbi:MAG: TerB family tellurite resistance protein [Candidatus Marinimicrobia bacterium]|nr:TerB family tellurite resistance protein [Candidatus Neomarinimicrobiota bacterium]